MEMTSIESEGRPADAREASVWRTRAGMFYLLKKLEWRRSYETPLHKGVTRLKTVICHFGVESLCWRDNLGLNMKKYFRPILFSLLSFWSAAACRAEGPYHLIKEIPVGGDGGWDYVSVDSQARLLYVSHGTKVVVIDLKKNEVAGEVADTPGIHGFAVAPELGRGFSSNGREGKASIVELKTLKTLSKVETGENPDAILYEPVQKEVYTFNGRGRSATVFR